MIPAEINRGDIFKVRYLSAPVTVVSEVFLTSSRTLCPGTPVVRVLTDNGRRTICRISSLMPLSEDES